MAYYKKNNEEHAYKKMADDLKKGEFDSLIFLYGVEQFLVDWACDELVKKYVNPLTKSMDLDIINMDGIKLEDLENACETIPMFSQKKVVIMRNYTNQFKSEENEFLKYISNLPATTMLIITGKDFGANYIKLGANYEFKVLNVPQVNSFIKGRLKKVGKKATPSVIKAITSETGYFNGNFEYTLMNLESDIQKIINYSENDEITVADIRECITNTEENDMFALMDALARNNKKIAFKLLDDIRLSGGNNFMILANMISQLELMMKTKQLTENGIQKDEIQKLLKIHEYRIKKAINFSKSYSVEKLKRILKIAYLTDEKIKLGILKDDIAIEMIIAEM